jgi:hypothetical protein
MLPLLAHAAVLVLAKWQNRNWIWRATASLPLHVVQVLLPDPAQACHIIHRACNSSSNSAHLLQLGASPAAANFSSKHLSTASMPAAVQLLQLVLQQALGTDEAGSCGESEEAAPGLQQYVVQLLQHLQEAAAVHEVGTCSGKEAFHCSFHEMTRHAACHIQQHLQEAAAVHEVGACRTGSGSGKQSCFVAAFVVNSACCMLCKAAHAGGCGGAQAQGMHTMLHTRSALRLFGVRDHCCSTFWLL